MFKYFKIVTLIALFSFFKNAQAQDWPNLAKYQAQNAKLMALGSGENRVVFMGNSITEGWPKAFFEGKNYVNRGISGQTTPQMVLRFRQDVIDLKPKVVRVKSIFLSTPSCTSALGAINELSCMKQPITRQRSLHRKLD